MDEMEREPVDNGAVEILLLSNVEAAGGAIVLKPSSLTVVPNFESGTRRNHIYIRNRPAVPSSRDQPGNWALGNL